MDERTRLIGRWLNDEASMAELCRQAGVSRKTGYKWVARYRADSPAGLVDRARAPHTHPQAIPAADAETLLRLRVAHPTWGPRKLVAYLAAQPPAREWPAPSSVGDLLARHGLAVAPRKRQHAPPRTQPLAHATAPNAVWCADFKGWFRTGDGAKGTPFTLSEAHSRYLLRCQALGEATETARVRPLCEAAIREFGLPLALRTDNGPPFASTGAGGLSPLSGWWVRLGIIPERIRPGKPSENGRHERLHRTLQAETAAPPAASGRAQQRASDRFRRLYNEERPHEALGPVPPAQVYASSPRPFPSRLPELTYPAGWEVRRVRRNGQLRCGRDWVYLSATLAGERVGLAPSADGCWDVYFAPVLLGGLDERRGRLRPPRPPASRVREYG
jgi:transposase InsO family protein